MDKIRKAIAESRNVPAVKTLANLGVTNLMPYLKRFGITSKVEPYLPTALGAAEITLMEMTSAYTTFPNDGVRVVPKLILKVTDYDGDVLKENLPSDSRGRGLLRRLLVLSVIALPLVGCVTLMGQVAGLYI